MPTTPDEPGGALPRLNDRGMGPPPARLEALDSLRGVAALVVALSHFTANTPLSTEPFTRNGPLCVDFFFVLSGMVICWNYQHTLGNWRQAAAFAVMRVGRVYPLHLATLLAMVVLVAIQHWRYPLLFSLPAFGPYTSVSAIFSNLLMIQSLNVHDRLTWNQPSWSVAAELWVYLAFAALCLLRWTQGRVFVVIMLLCTLALMAAPGGMGSTHDFGALRCLLGFATGVLCCRLHSRFPALGGTARELAVCAAVLLLPATLPYGDLRFLCPLVYGAAVVVFAADAGSVSRWLRSGPLQYLGRISYSIYMNHFLVVMLFWVGTGFLNNHLGLDLWGRPDQVYGRTQWQGWMFVLAYLTAVLLISHWTYRFIEVPGRKASRAIAQKLAGVRPKEGQEHAA